MREKIVLVLLLLVGFCATAQTINVKGIVKDTKTGETLLGVSVLIKGTSVGTETDFDGLYRLSKVEKGATLVFNYLGYAKKEVVVHQQTINVSLEESAESLDEIIVVGYGTQRKKEVTGAVSVVNAEVIEKLNPTRIEQALQGQISGVNITSSSGAPGSSLNIRIRGVSTNGDSRPLILVDGNPITDLSVINPNDIKSVNVLKDATAGIYGVRAANGVILIETKTGSKKSKLKINIDFYSAFQQTSKKIDVLGAADFAKYVNDASGESKPYTISSTGIYDVPKEFAFVHPTTGEVFDSRVSATEPISPLITDTDWQDEVFKTAVMYSTNISASGGTKKLAYSFGISYLNQDGIIGLGKSNYNRLTARTNLKYDITKNIKISATAIYSNERKNKLQEGGIGAVLYNAINSDPLTPVKDPIAPEGFEDIYGGYGIVLTSQREVFNPIAQTNNTYNKSLTDKISPTLGVDYTFLDHFTATSKYQLNHASVLTDILRPLAYYGSSKQSNLLERNGYVDNLDMYDDYTWDNYITYTNTFNENHNLTALLATSIWKESGKFAGMSGESLIVKGVSVNSFDGATLANAEVKFPRFQPNALETGSDIFENRLFSVFTRIQYNYKQKYLFSGVLRRDVSSRFGPENKVGYFPSASLGWNISEESFLQNNSFISSLKLRVSYGIIGNDRIGDFRFIGRLNGEGDYSNNEENTNSEILRGVAIGDLSNPEIKWENQITGNVGFDFAILNNRINISIDAFNKKTEDLLISAQTSGLTGVAAPGSSAPIINAGTVENRGVEFLISYNNNFTKDFKINTSFNISTLKNEVTFVGSRAGFEQDGGFGISTSEIPSRMDEGFPIGYFYGYKTEGIYQTQAEIDALNEKSPSGIYHDFTGGIAPGDLKFTDTNGDNEITEDDKGYIGDPIPDITMGFNLGFTYKNIDFSSATIASIGNDLVRDYERNALLTNKSTRILDAWTPPTSNNYNNTTPRITSGASVNTDLFSDYFVEDASYVRIQNVQIGYTFSEKILKKTGMDKIRIYASANNLHTFTNYSGYDPSVIGGGEDNRGEPLKTGIDKGFYPVAKTYIFGLNLIF